MAATEFKTNLIKNEATIPEPDDLIAGPDGAGPIDIVRVRVTEAGTIKRGTLMFKSSITEGESLNTTTDVCWLPCTAAGLVATSEFAILCDDVTLTATEYTDTACYFGGDFHEDKVILPEGKTIPAAKEILRTHRIFLRPRHKFAADA